MTEPELDPKLMEFLADSEDPELERSVPDDEEEMKEEETKTPKLAGLARSRRRALYRCDPERVCGFSTARTPQTLVHEELDACPGRDDLNTAAPNRKRGRT